VGDVSLNGASLPAIRIELNPRALFKYGIGLEDVRAAVSAANANSPKGDIQQKGQSFQVYANDNASLAKDYHDLIVAYRNNAAVKGLSDVAEVLDGVENVRNLGTFNVFQPSWCRSPSNRAPMSSRWWTGSGPSFPSEERAAGQYRSGHFVRHHKFDPQCCA